MKPEPLNLKAVEARLQREAYDYERCDDIGALCVSLRETLAALKDVMEISEDPKQMRFRHVLAVGIWERAAALLRRYDCG